MFGSLTTSLHNMHTTKGMSFGKLLRPSANYQSIPFKSQNIEPVEKQQSEDDIKALQKDTRSWVEGV